jgi:hypothetical protein
MFNDDRGRNSYTQKFTGSEVRAQLNGTLSFGQRKRLREAVQALSAIAQWKTLYCKEEGKHYRFKLNLITLTIPSSCKLSDREIIKKCLTPFLKNLTRDNKKLLSIWKAEVTDAGTLHFHITSNIFIHYTKLRLRWNKQLYKAGILEKERIETANSTDVHAVKKVRNLSAYLCAYISKKDLYTKVLHRYFRRYKKQLTNSVTPVFRLPKNYFRHIKRKPQCQLWSCSRALQQTKMSDCYVGTEIEREFFSNKEWELRAVQSDYFLTCYINAGEWRQSMHIRAAWNRFMSSRMREERDNPDIYYKIS